MFMIKKEYYNGKVNEIHNNYNNTVKNIKQKPNSYSDLEKKYNDLNKQNKSLANQLNTLAFSMFGTLFVGLGYLGYKIISN